MKKDKYNEAISFVDDEMHKTKNNHSPELQLQHFDFKENEQE